MYESRGSRAVGRRDAERQGLSTAPTPPSTRERVDVDGLDGVGVNELVRRFQVGGDVEALGAVMAAFDWVAVSCARRMHRRGEPIEDLEQVAREALMGAVSRFDVDRGV